MYHEGHPDKDYEVANRVEVFEPPRTIAWLPGHAPGRATSAGADDAALEYGGWIWRYDLEPVGDDQTNVTLTYDWSAVPPEGREIIQFPPFESDAPGQLAEAPRRAGGGDAPRCSGCAPLRYAP